MCDDDNVLLDTFHNENAYKLQHSGRVNVPKYNFCPSRYTNVHRILSR